MSSRRERRFKLGGGLRGYRTTGFERGAVSRSNGYPRVDVDPLRDRAERRIRLVAPKWLVGGDRQGRAFRFAVAEAKGNLDAAAQRVRGLGRGSGGALSDGQPAALEHLRAPVGDTFGEGRNLVQRGGRHGLKPQRSVRLFVPCSVGDEHVQVRVNVEAAAGPLQEAPSPSSTCRTRCRSG